MIIILSSFLLAGCLGLDPMGTASDSGTGIDDTGPVWSTFGGMTFPETVEFGQVELGSDPAYTEVTLTNDSDGNIKLTEVVLDAGSDFEAEFTSVPWVIGAGGQYVIGLSFDPSAEGLQTGNLSFGVESEEGLATIGLSGEGVTEITGTDSGGTDSGTGDGGSTTSGSLGYSTSSIAFGNVAVGSSDSSSVTISNNTGADVLIGDIVTSSTVVSATGVSVPVVMSTGSSQTIEVRFAPTEERAYSERITVDTDLGQKVIDVTGTGEESCSICAPVIDVDTGGSATEMEFVSFFDIPDVKTVTILNIGDEILTVRDVHVTNEDIGAGDFAVSWGGSTTVAAGSSTSFSVSYTCPDLLCLDLPNDALDWNVLHIESDDPSTPDWTIGLNGT